MTSFSGLAALLSRRSRMKAYQTIRCQTEAMSDEDLTDIGLRRYQLGHVARVKFFG
jgi:uncharacterized protein YjiS (DUF1127 family)